MRNVLSMLKRFLISSQIMFSGEIFLFCKGADSSIFPRVAEGKIEQIRSRVERNAVVRSRVLASNIHVMCVQSRKL